MTGPSVLLVGGRGFVRRGLGPALRARGYAVRQAETATAATCSLRSHGATVVVACGDEIADGRGADIVSVLRAAAPQVPVVLLAAAPDPRDVRRAFLGGAADYLVEPFTLAEVVAAVERAAGRDRATPTLTLASTGFAETLINAMEAKNTYLRGHSQRVADLAAATAETMGLPPDVVEHVRLAGRLHDIGKIGIRESVLDKPGPLTPDEYTHVKDHVRIGLDILAPMIGLGEVLDFIADHHERPDGSGYPRGLAGEQISIGGRVLAAADTFDALTSRRAYRDSRSERETLQYMAGLVGKSLFADVFDALRQSVDRPQSLVFLGEMRAPGAHMDHPAGVSDIRALVAAIGGLPKRERLALTLHYLEDLSDTEIAGLVGGEPRSVMELRQAALLRVAKAG